MARAAALRQRSKPNQKAARLVCWSFVFRLTLLQREHRPMHQRWAPFAPLGGPAEQQGQARALGRCGDQLTGHNPGLACWTPATPACRLMWAAAARLSCEHAALSVALSSSIISLGISQCMKSSATGVRDNGGRNNVADRAVTGRPTGCRRHRRLSAAPTLPESPAAAAACAAMPLLPACTAPWTCTAGRVSGSRIDLVDSGAGRRDTVAYRSAPCHAPLDQTRPRPL